VLQHRESVSSQTDTEKGQEATVTGSSTRGIKKFTVRVVKHWTRLHIKAASVLTDSHNSTA